MREASEGGGGRGGERGAGRDEEGSEPGSGGWDDVASADEDDDGGGGGSGSEGAAARAWVGARVSLSQGEGEGACEAQGGVLVPAVRPGSSHPGCVRARVWACLAHRALPSACTAARAQTAAAARASRRTAAARATRATTTRRTRRTGLILIATRSSLWPPAWAGGGRAGAGGVWLGPRKRGRRRRGAQVGWAATRARAGCAGCMRVCRGSWQRWLGCAERRGKVWGGRPTRRPPVPWSDDPPCAPSAAQLGAPRAGADRGRGGGGGGRGGGGHGRGGRLGPARPARQEGSQRLTG
jgi:hypothetical protein